MNSYQEIFRSSWIIGGAQALTYVISLVRMKAVAILLGPSGVGLISLYQSTIGMVGAISGFGITSSGIREIAKSKSEGDRDDLARRVSILKRSCWVTGLLGWMLTLIFSVPLSELVFGSKDHAISIAIVGSAIFLGALSGGYQAILQGTRKISHLALSRVLAMLLGTSLAILLYYLLDEGGIVPAFISGAALTLLMSWWFTRGNGIAGAEVSLKDVITGSRELFQLGFAFMWNAVIAAGLEIAIRTVIARENGIEAVGLYQAAWSVSVLFAGFVLQALQTDYFPRLTAVIGDSEAANRLVNQQIEMGVLFALPGLIITIAFAEHIIRLLYTAEFSSSAALLPLLILGTFAKVIGWPIEFIQQSSGAARLLVFTGTTIVLLQLGLVVAFVPRYGPLGASYAYVISYGCYFFTMLLIGRWLIGFKLDLRNIWLILAALFAVLIMLSVSQLAPKLLALIVGIALSLLCTISCVALIAARLGFEHPIARAVIHLPGGLALLTRLGALSKHGTRV